MKARRKGPVRAACDLCYTKKIKCDLAKPTCANCNAYDIQCTHHGVPNAHDPGERELPEHEPPPEQTTNPSHQQPAQPALPDFPPWPEIEPVVEQYLNGCNRIVPLLDPSDVRAAFAHWHDRPEERDTFTWTQLNVVLAVAYQSGSYGTVQAMPAVSSHINNAQFVLSDLLAGDVHLPTVRVLVGMVMLFNTMPDLRPATLLVASALRLAHELELHTRASHGPDPVANACRDRVFWAAYLLDKDISLHIRRPAVQLDADIDLDLPSVEPWDGAGFIFTTDGQHSFHYFRERVRLSRIQGALYDGLWSVRARKLPEHRRAEKKVAVKRSLADWEQSVPWAFRPGVFPRTAPNDVHVHLVKMHYEHASCIAFINGVDGVDLEIVRHAASDGWPASSSHGIPWASLAEVYRQPMADFVIIPTRNAGLVWTVLQAHLTGLFCLLGNILQNPRHAMAVQDLATCDSSLGFVTDEVLDVAGHRLKNLAELRDLFTKLLERAHSCVWGEAS